MTAHRCTCLSDDAPLCCYCRSRQEAAEYRAEEIASEAECEAAAAREMWGAA